MSVPDIRIRIGESWERAVADVVLWAREVTSAINAMRTQERAIVIDTAELPITVELSRGGRPVAVELLRAVEQGAGDARVISGGSVEWDSSTPSGVRLHSFSALASSTRYDAVIAVKE